MTLKVKDTSRWGFYTDFSIKKDFKGIFKNNTLREAIESLRYDEQDFENIISRLKVYSSYGYSRRFDSWEVISPAIMAKELDKSSFDYHGSGIPKGMSTYFNVENIINGENVDLILLYENKKYKAKITREASSLGRTRIFWDKELSVLLKKRYFEYYEIIRIKDVEFSKRPKMFFESIGGNMYLVSFTQTQLYKTLREYQLEIDKSVDVSRSDNSYKRKERLRNAISKPESMVVKTTVYKRNPDVIVEVLERANGYCEKCGSKAPFHRASDNSPYLEVHHNVPLAEGGTDTVDNAIAVCPNCHRELHYGL
ncbi:HNH endonuclease signature motif containing protein [Clostridiaceae bacterium M8S5]|nr:HNH endonuclease signature motif containing protein [Clostridiaceae bacterium M8S5]